MAELGGSAGLMQRKLDTDYTTWAVQFQAYLETVELWDTNEIPLPPNPEDEAKFAHWKMMDRRALGRIKLGILPAYLNKLDGCATAKEAWDKLKVAFHASTMAREVGLQREMTALRKAQDEGIVAYTGRAKGIHDELAGVSEEQISDRRAIIQMLAGIIEPEYESIVTFVTNERVPPTWEDVLARLLVAEASIKNKRSMTETVTTSPRSGATSAYGATTEERKRLAAERRRRVTSWNCGMRGHYSNECNRQGRAQDGSGAPHKGGGPATGGGGAAGFMGTAALSARVIQRSTGRPDSGQSNGPAAQANPARVQMPATSAGQTEWVVDSGATRHKMKDTGTFTDYQSDQVREVTLADGRTIPIVGEGAVKFMGNHGWELNLSDVVHAPAIAANLMSVREMTKKGAKVTFEVDTVAVLIPR